MKKNFVKTAAACGLCLTLLAGGAAAAFGNPFGGMQQNDPFSGMQQNGDMRQNGPFGDMQQNANVTYASSPSTVAEGATTNSAASLTADEANATTITMSASNSSVKIDAAGTYIVTGTCADGSITVKKNTTGVVLILKDLDLTSTSGAPLSVNKGAEAKIIISGSVTLTDKENPDDENSTDADVADAFDGAAIKVKAGASAYITGTGSLTLNGSAKNGIKAGEETALVIDGPSVAITAANDGVNGGYDVAILSGSVTVSAGDDGIHADRILTIGSDSTAPAVTITDSYEGIEATVVNLVSGTVKVTASDDGVNAANSDGTYASELAYSINVIGGSITVNAGFDGLDSNGNINLISGSATIQSANRGGDAGIDYDGSLYVSDDFELNNASGVAGPDGGGMGGGQPGGMGGMNGRQPGFQPGGRTGGMNGGRQMTPPTQEQDGTQPTAPPDWNRDGTQPTAPPDRNQDGTQQTTPPAQPGAQQTQLNVVPTAQSLTVNGTSRDTEIYNINGSNFFKLRDVAALLNGTASQFSVDYDAAQRAISVKTGGAYAAQGGELAKGQDRSASCVKSTQTLYVNGEQVELTAYNIGGNNFFQLRELGAALGFDVEYDASTNTIVVTSR